MNGMSNDPKQNNRLDHPDLGAIFDKHVKCEFEDHDVDATMKTIIIATEKKRRYLTIDSYQNGPGRL